MAEESRARLAQRYLECFPVLPQNLVAAPRDGLATLAERTALWAALIIHARSALVSVRTPLRSVKLNLCYDAGTRQQAHARTTARGVGTPGRVLCAADYAFARC